MLPRVLQLQGLGQKGGGWPRNIRTAVRDAPFNHCLRLGIHSDLTGTVDHAIANDGLRVDGEWGRGFVSLHCNSCRHDD